MIRVFVVNVDKEELMNIPGGCAWYVGDPLSVIWREAWYAKEREQKYRKTMRAAILTILYNI